MKRRNFLKGLFTSYAAVSTYFSFKYFNEKNVEKPFDNKSKEDDEIKNAIDKNAKFLNMVEIPIVYHCNLNCAHCDHFSSIAPKYIMPVEVYEKDVKKLSQITKGKLKELIIVGGEPFLHDKISEIMKISRKYFPKTRIEILTNGTLLEKQPDEVFLTANKEDVGIYISYYRTGKKLFDFEKITEKIDKFKVKIRISYPKFEFQLMNLEKTAKHDIKKRYTPCYSKLWPILDNGKFYVCSTVNGVDKFFNRKFENDKIPYSNDDVLDIHKISTLDELLDFYSKPKKMCAYCNYYISDKAQWQKARFSPYEWLKKLPKA